MECKERGQLLDRYREALRASHAGLLADVEPADAASATVAAAFPELTRARGRYLKHIQIHCCENAAQALCLI
jgi:hypothetical protein